MIRKETPSKWRPLGLTYEDPRLIEIRERKKAKVALERYLTHLRSVGRSKVYVRQSQMVVANFFGDSIDDNLSTFSRKRIGHALSRLHRRVQPNTYSHYSRVLRHFFDFCKENGWVAGNFIVEYDLKYLRTVAFFTPRQLDLLFGAMPYGEMRDACLVIYYTGIQRSELDLIVGVDYPTSKLILVGRRVFCPPDILKLVEKRRYFDSKRVAKHFQRFMWQFDFKGNLRYLQNSYLVREARLGTPIPVLTQQLGMTKNSKIKEKLARLEPKWEEAKTVFSKPFNNYT